MHDSTMHFMELGEQNELICVKHAEHCLTLGKHYIIATVVIIFNRWMAR